MSTTICQVMGFIVSSLGVAGCIVSTSMDMWSTQDLYDNPVTAVFQYQGLWRSCVRQSSGFTECRPYFTILGLPAMFQAVRALMIVGIVLGILGLLVCIFALKCIRIGSMEDSAKANMTLTSGIMFIIAVAYSTMVAFVSMNHSTKDNVIAARLVVAGHTSDHLCRAIRCFPKVQGDFLYYVGLSLSFCLISGLCAITGVSVFANMLVTNFWMSTANMYQGMQNVQNRYTFGSALFVGWVAGGLALVGGILMCLACRGLIPEESRYKAVSYNASGRNISYRTGPYKVGSGYEPETKTRKGAGYEEAPRSEDGRRSYPSKYDYV
ncbi:Cldn18 [Columba guinea]|nr:Cldn18 [Columba guinea]